MNKNTLILTYHNIVNSNKDMYLYDTYFQTFKKQMELLKVMPDLNICDLETIDKSSPMNIILTFDDGYKSWSRNVLKILKELNFKAYFFICIENIHKWHVTKNLNKHVITKEDILKLRDNGMLIGSHSLKHRFLHELSNKEIYYDLNRSRNILEDLLKEKVKYFSVPRGMHNEKILNIAQQVGYKYIFTSTIGINKGLDLPLNRVSINRNMELSEFQNILKTNTINKMAFNQRLKNGAKMVLGIKKYNKLRRILVPRAE